MSPGDERMLIIALSAGDTVLVIAAIPSADIDSHLALLLLLRQALNHQVFAPPPFALVEVRAVERPFAAVLRVSTPLHIEG